MLCSIFSRRCVFRYPMPITRLASRPLTKRTLVERLMGALERDAASAGASKISIPGKLRLIPSALCDALHFEAVPPENLPLYALMLDNVLQGRAKKPMNP